MQKSLAGFWASPTERCICNLGEKGGREGGRESWGNVGDEDPPARDFD